MTSHDRPSLGVGLVGYAFMGAAHSQAWRTAPPFFDRPLRPQLTVLAGRNQAAVIYPHTQAADGIHLARLGAQEKNVSDLVSPEVPRRITLNAPVVTADNVDQYIDRAFES